jgi:hypothetical protein
VAVAGHARVEPGEGDWGEDEEEETNALEERHQA